MAWVKAVRPLNLAFIFLAQFGFQYLIILPLMDQPGTLGHFFFFLLSLSTVLIAGGGNLINDYFDSGVDQINKPGKNILSKGVSRNRLSNMAFLCSGIGIFIGLFLAWRVGKVQLVSIHVLCWILLYVYSSQLKKTFLIGNVVVSLCVAMTFLVVVIFERNIFEGLQLSSPIVRNTFFNSAGHRPILWILIIMMSFSFLLNLVREVVKDIEDFEGDDSYGYQTSPVVLGIKGAQWLAGLLVLVLLALVEYFAQKFNLPQISLYLKLCIQLPLLLLFGLILTAKKTERFKGISVFCKLIMFFGLGLMLLIYLQIP